MPAGIRNAPITSADKSRPRTSVGRSPGPKSLKAVRWYIRHDALTGNAFPHPLPKHSP